MAEPKGQLHIDLLGTSFTIGADQPGEYLQSIYNHYKEVVAEVRQTSGVIEPLKIAIIAGILLSDELSKERLNMNGSAPNADESVLMEQSARKMIEDIDSIIYSLSPPDACPV